MEVEYVDNMVKWLYDDKEIIYETKGVEFATDVATAIYIELMFDGIYEYRFVGFSGKDMVEICMEYVEDRAEKIYIYCSFEGGVQSCNFFYKVNGKVVKKSRLNDVIVDGQEEYDVSIPRQRDVMAILNEDMVALRKLCEEYQREMPTQIKLIYDVAANSLNADYSYDIIYSNDKDKMADDILEEWFESEKSKEE